MNTPVEEQIMEEIMKIIQRYSAESDIKTATMMGLLEMAKLQLFKDISDNLETDESEDLI